MQLTTQKLMVGASGLLFLFLMGAGCALSARETGGCKKDTDCRKGRICSEGKCKDSPQRLRCCACPEASVPKPPHPRLTLKRAKSRHPWPMFGRDPHRSGASPHTGPEKKPRVDWKFQVKGPISGGVVVDAAGRVFFGSHDKHLYALSAEGKLLWKYATGDKIWGTPALVKDGKLVVVGSDDDHLHAVTAAKGASVFKVKLGSCNLQAKGARFKKRGRAAPDAVRCDVDSSPAIDGKGRVVVGSEGLHLVTPKGEAVASYNRGRHVRSSPAFRDDGVYLFGARDDQVHAVNEQGKLLWSFVTGSDVDSTPVLATDGTLYVGSDDGRLYALWPDGKKRWAVVTGGPVRAAAAVGGDGTVYFGSHDGKMYAIEPKSGKATWAFPTAGRIQSSPVVDVKGNVYFGSQDGYLYGLDREGRMLWRFGAGSDVDSSPTIAGEGRIYVGSDSGTLYALSSP